MNKYLRSHEPHPEILKISIKQSQESALAIMLGSLLTTNFLDEKHQDLLQ